MSSLYKVGPCKRCQIKTDKKTIKGLCQYHYKLEQNLKYLKRKKEKATKAKSEGKIGEYELFETIFDSRDKICFINGTALMPKQYYIQKNNFHFLFHHVLPKSIYPSLRLSADNIIMVHPDVHFEIENRALSDLIRKNPNYEKLKTLILNLKAEYYARR